MTRIKVCCEVQEAKVVPANRRLATVLQEVKKGNERYDGKNGLWMKLARVEKKSLIGFSGRVNLWTWSGQFRF